MPRLNAQQQKFDRQTAAVIAYFETTYGRDDTKLQMWQNLCSDVGVPAGPSITQCKKNLKRVYICIVDFVAARSSGGLVRTFTSYKALRTYIQTDRSKMFPLRKAKENPILSWMLIEVL